ncbi:GPI mannosyltransferase 2 [Aspergillus unguis]
MKTASARLASRPPFFLDPTQPVKSLSIAYWLWKAVVFVVVANCPGLGYDTSSSLLPFQGNGSVDVISAVQKNHASLAIPLKFVRWDSIYFAHISRIGYVFEQEWAFSYAYGYVVNFLSSLVASNDSSGVTGFALSAVALSHVAHYLSVLALYRLSINVFGHDTEKKKLVCFLSAALHIVSPAGAFLSAPYGEPVFSFLNITGFYIYSSSHLDLSSGKRSLSHVKLILSGCFFALATAVRSNGLLSGILLAYDALKQSYDIISRRLSGSIVRLCVVVISGCIVALGLVVPQYLAYIAYCTDGRFSRPWCQSFVPSIYGWVQDHYWGVGFLRYWTLSNLPLFLLGAPMLGILFLSCFWALNEGPLSTTPRTSPTISHGPATHLLTQLAIAQFILTAMALTSYHVQIINRISSGYPLWYWYLAYQALGILDHSLPVGITRKIPFLAIVQVMVVYALVQGVLFGSFLPPA